MIKVSEHLPDKERTGFVQPGGEKVQGDLTDVCKLLDGGMYRKQSQTLLSSAQGKEAMGTNRNTRNSI